MATVQPMSNTYYVFFLNMWIMRRVDEAYLLVQVEKERLTQEEYEMIIATPQMDA